MSEQLIIRIPAHQGPVDWLIRDSEGNVTQGPETVDNAPIPELTAKYHAIALVPTNALALTRVIVPKTTRAKMLQAIPYILEDQVTDDLDNLHFAMGDGENQSGYPVAIINSQQMQNWLTPYEQQGVHFDLMIPDVLALPLQENSWSILIENQHALVRTGPCDGFNVEVENLHTFIAISLDEAAQENHLPTSINIYSHEKMLPLKPEEYENQGIAVHQHTIHGDILSWHTEVINHQVPLNLLQGEYRADKQYTHIKKRWLLVGAIAAAWLVIGLTTHIAQMIYYGAENSHWEKQVNNTYFKIFPKATEVVDPKIRVQREVQTVRDAQSGGAFLSILSGVGQVITKTPQAKVQNLSFSDNKMILQMEANTFDTLQKIQDQIQKYGLVVKQDNATTKGNTVQARFTISERIS